MKYLIVVGDSFCSYPGIKGIDSGWPQTLADTLHLELVCYGAGGLSWWAARNFISNLDKNIIDNAELIVFAHTYGGRIPTLNVDIGMVDKFKTPVSDLELALYYYYKYINDNNFLEWAQEQWLYEIKRTYGHKKLCHLHCFPWTLKYNYLLSGINIITNLSALSLNEIDSKEFTLYNDKRNNHLSFYNNTQLALQIANLYGNYRDCQVELDVSNFEQLTDRWFDLKNWN